jgi:hypothetical protein
MPVDEYGQVLADVSALIQAHREADLRFYHAIGSQVNRLLDKSTYGSGTVGKLAADLKRLGLSIGTATLYKASQFNATFDKAGLERLIAARWSWRNVARISARSYDGVRDELVRRNAQGEVQPPKLRNADWDHLCTLARTGRPAAYSSLVDALDNLFEAYRQRLDELIKLTDEIGAVPMQRQRLNGRLQACEQQLRRHRDTLTACRTSLAAVIEVSPRSKAA